MDASGPSSNKRKSTAQFITDLLGTLIAIGTLTLPLFFIINLSQNQLEQSLQTTKVITMRE